MTHGEFIWKVSGEGVMGGGAVFQVVHVHRSHQDKSEGHRMSQCPHQQTGQGP